MAFKKNNFCENKESEKKNTQHAVTGNGSNNEEDAHALLQQLHSSPGGGVCLGAAPITAQLDPQGLHTLQLPQNESELLPESDVYIEPLQVSVGAPPRLWLPLPCPEDPREHPLALQRLLPDGNSLLQLQPPPGPGPDP